ncbi:MAG: VWA domain-containing protein [Spirosomaceae bacterium]|nr:VWA domain-containing protein [Spirosomataceae bacterium]
MVKSELVFQSSPWFILLCLLIGGIYAFVLYQRKNNFSKVQNWALSALRGGLVSIVCFLLLNPLLRSNKSIIEKPTVVVAIDNSSSMLTNGKSKLDNLKAKIAEIKSDIESKNGSVEYQLLNETDEIDLQNLKFDQKNTNLSALLSNIKNNYEGRNLTDVILVTDGITNSGISPTYGKYNFKIHTVGLGDTTQKRDVKLNAIYANRIAYLGNKFPLQAEISAFGFGGKTTTVLLKQAGQVIDKQTITFDRNDDLKQVTFYSTTNQKGIQRFSIEVAPIGGESSTKNNTKEIYIDVVDGKEKILLVSLNPHPDIKALKSIIEKNELYELSIKNLQSDNISDIGNQPFDVLILHQIPDIYGSGNALASRLLAQNKPTIFILGSQTNAATFNGMQQTMALNIQNNRTDKVTAKVNPNFKLFNLDPEKLSILDRLPPIIVPFGEFKPMTGSEVILYQRVGSLATQKPLLTVNTNINRKTAIISGEGIWQWRMEEFELTEKQEIVDEIITKTIQLISIKDDKRKLRVYPVSQEFSVDEKVVFENETYNDIFERIYNQDISLEITDEQGKKNNYNYTITKENSRFEITGLKEGVFKYKASTQVLGKSEMIDGQFIIRNTDLENLSTKADFNLLKTLSSQNNGKFVELKNIEDLKQFLNSNKSPDKVTSIEEMNEFINLRWIFFLILLMAFIEWGIRKYIGTY